MTRRSLRMTPIDYEKVPPHCSLWYETVSEEADGREIPAFFEAFPLHEDLRVFLGWGWESAAFKILLAAENQLIRDAELIKQEAIEVFKEARKYDNCNIPNLGITVRIRKDTLGPRISWVKFVGKGKTGQSGRIQHYTQPIPLAGRYRTSKRVFKAFPDHVRNQLIELEEQAAVIRYQTEKLARLRDLIYEPPSPR